MTDVITEAVSLEQMRAQWLEAWPRALHAWSQYLQLHSPKLCGSAAEAAAEGLESSFAMIRLQDQSVIVDLTAVRASGLERFPVEVLAHEIGHHVLAPSTLTDHARMLARMRRALPTQEAHAPYIANLYTDLLINDRLQRSAGLRMADIYRCLKVTQRSSVWRLYIRIYEMLWSQPQGSLGSGAKLPDNMEGDAWLGARLVRHFARERLDGAGRFAALILPYLLEDAAANALSVIWHDTRQAGKGGQPAGLTEIGADEELGAIHPASDPDLADITETVSTDAPPVEVEQQSAARGQARQPYEYGEILRAAGVDLSDHELAVRYYRERASTQLIPFPTRRAPVGTDPLPEGVEPWNAGEPLDRVDWFQSVLVSPRVIPGLSTVQRVWGTETGHEAQRVPLDLDLYVDSSGSMPDPKRILSYPALGGAIVCLSALRAGARVKATLWSDKNRFTTTAGFVRDEQAILEVLTGYLGGATQFPIHKLRDTHRQAPTPARPRHILIISDDGVSTLFDRDEQGQSGWQIAREALAQAGGGGTLLLNLPENWESAAVTLSALQTIRRARDEGGWNVHRVSNWEELTSFARAFSRMKYGSP